MVDLDEVAVDSLDEFLEQKGAIPLLCEISPDGTRWSELTAALDVSHTTVSKRLEEAQAVSVITLKPIHSDRGAGLQYTLTSKSNHLRVVFDSLGLTKTYYRFKEVRDQYQSREAEAREWVATNKDRLAEIEDLPLEFDIVTEPPTRNHERHGHRVVGRASLCPGTNDSQQYVDDTAGESENRKPGTSAYGHGRRLQRMLVDARVFDPAFVPTDVVHRDAELDALTAALNPITDGRAGDHALLCGPSGTGKTCLAHYLLDHLREAVLDLHAQYVNCWEDHSRFKTLYRVLDGLDQAFDVHRQSTPTDALVDRLHEYDGPPYVVVLDEVDQLRETNVLYDLYRTPGLTMMLIANREADLFTRLDDRVASRLRTATRVAFDSYSTAALVAILEDRVRWGLHDDAITTAQLETIAEGAAGDARVAIGILRGAAREASQAGADRITDAHIEAAIPEAKAEIKQKTEAKLTTHQRILYDIIVAEGEVAAGDLYTAYCDRADEPMTQRTVRNYLQKLRHYHLIQAEGENRGRVYQPVS
jgi:orc1/cdc6 family replication initiation protein